MGVEEGEGRVATVRGAGEMWRSIRSDRRDRTDRCVAIPVSDLLIHGESLCTPAGLTQPSMALRSRAQREVRAVSSFSLIPDGMTKDLSDVDEVVHRHARLRRRKERQDSRNVYKQVA